MCMIYIKLMYIFYANTGAFEFRIDTAGRLDINVVSGGNSICPVISILGTALNSGTGTKTNPFKIN